MNASHIMEWLVAWLCALLCVLSPAAQGSMQTSEADRAVINRSNDPVWFDATDGTVRPIARSNAINVDDRHDSIAGPTRKTPPGWWSNFFKNLGDIIAFLFQGWPVLFFLCLVSLVTLIGYILYRYVLEPQQKSGPLPGRRQSEQEKAKLLDLPFEVEPSMLGLFAQAERFRAAGDYSKAIVYLFSYALVEMDGARCIHLARGKTNRAYLRELKGRDGLRDFTHQLVQAFEFAFFGKHVLSQEAFERIWSQVPSFEAELKFAGSSASRQVISPQTVNA